LPSIATQTERTYVSNPAPENRYHMSFTRFKVLLLTAASVITVNESAIANAETNDTHISIHYRARSVRVRPTPRTGGGDVDFGIVLHADGTVEDSYSVKDGKHGSSKSKLGPSKGLVYRVLDSGTVTRTADLGTHYHKITIHTSGKNCTADVEFILKPGEKEYREFSTELKTMALFSSLRTEYVTCVIE
jgi:hypothetical protein